MRIAKKTALMLPLLWAACAFAVVSIERVPVPAEQTPLLLKKKSEISSGQVLRYDSSEAEQAFTELLLALHPENPENRESQANLKEFNLQKENLSARGYSVESGTSLSFHHSSTQKIPKEGASVSFEAIFMQRLQKDAKEPQSGRIYPHAYLRAYVVFQCKKIKGCRLIVFAPHSAGIKWAGVSGPRGAQSSAGGSED